MNQHGVQEVQAPRLQHFQSSLTPSYNLSSVLSIIPGFQFFNRLRKENGLIEPPLTLNLSAAPATGVTPNLTEISNLAGETYQQFSNPWGFFTSGYIVGLLITAILLHRMQNVVLPSPRRARRAYRSPLHRMTLWERLHAAILPLDFSRTLTRLAFLLPSIYFLSKMLIIWTILVLQTCEVQLISGLNQSGPDFRRHFGKLVRWTLDKEMAQICWSTFCAVCGAFWVEGLIKTLDGLGGGGFPLGGMNSLSPFHLVSYAFLLHIYSSPLAHGFHPVDDLPSRPDKHVVITITIALLQLSIFHILSISKRLSTHRLLPTTLTSLLSLTHFHTTIYFHLTNGLNSKLATLPATDLRHSTPYMSAVARYPLLNYLPNLFETVLLATILLTVAVNAIAQLLVRGRIDHVLTGLGFFNGLPHDDGAHNGFFANLPYEEDFVIILLRIGVASLEATGLRGWNNEVAPIQRPRVRPRRIWASNSGVELGHVMEDTYGRVRIGKLGVTQVQCGSTSRPVVPCTGGDKLQPSRNVAPRRYGSRLRRGFSNDVRIIDLGHAASSGPFSRPWKRSIVAFWQFLVVLWGVIHGLVRFLLDKARRRGSKREQKRWKVTSEEEDESELTNEDGTVEGDAEVYQRFLRGEDISDDDEDAMAESSNLSDEEMSDETDEEEPVQREAEMVDLLTDLLRSPEIQDRRTTLGHEDDYLGSDGEVALAHLLHGSAATSRPLTRRVWNTLTRDRVESNVDGTSPGDHRAEELVSKRYFKNVEQRDGEKGVQHICVICMLESREIICWPCRCLAMCDDCRDALASRTPASKHRCPCCRQIVDGYSKIYIP